ncbi:hypothetical protein ACSMEV_07725 [Pseudomonas sp. MLB6B]
MTPPVLQDSAVWLLSYRKTHDGKKHFHAQMKFIFPIAQTTLRTVERRLK